ncbi:MAG: beta-lactamase domain protein [Gemmatimonadetes bacterium]|nr:beta-lactamase domain protein [Gemmatimonadota bacterium]
MDRDWGSVFDLVVADSATFVHLALSSEMTLLPRSVRSASIAALALLTACAERSTSPGLLAPGPLHRAVVASAPALVINEFMADPSAVADDQGEWFEVYNFGSAALSLQNWKIQSGSDAVHTITTAVSVPAGGRAVLARSGTKTNGGATAAYVYGTGTTLANASDWLAIRDAAGATVDSIAWSGTTAGTAWGLKNAGLDNTTVGGTNWQLQTSLFGKGDRGTPTLQNNGYVAPAAPAVATVRVSPDSAAVVAGSTVAFSAQGSDASGAPVATTFTWSSGNTAVATVSATGVATGVSAGSALIRATSANGIADDALLVVTATAPPGSGTGSELVVRVLDIGQGDATLIENGTSRVLIDGGPGEARMGVLLDSLGLNGKTIDLVILSHEHLDHHGGLRELFRTSRNIAVRYFMENQNASTAVALTQLRDSIGARVGRGQLIYRDSDDPCGNGSAVCTFTLNGGAKVHVLRPNPAGTTANNRSTPVKLVGPDSASFTMWFAGDAEHEAISWFLGAAGYTSNPGMDVDVLKADHHGSCNGVTSAYVNALSPTWVTASVSSTNTYGHMHAQTKGLLQSLGRPWYRTDENGTITFRSPGTAGGGFAATVLRGTASMTGSGDGSSAQASCNPLP